MPVKSTDPIASLSQYVAYVEKYCDGDKVLFRGQPVDKPLLPKIARLRTKPDITTAERGMLAEWKRQGPGYIDSHPVTDWDWLALAQHFGMATRLLDWTLNPFAALWFAVERPCQKKATGVVWFFEAADDDYLAEGENVGPLDIDKTRVFRPRHLTRRIIAQSGWFTAHKYIETKENKYVALETNRRFKDRLTKLTVPGDSFADLRRDLDRFGVNAASLYGGPDGLCRHLEWMHSFYDDEEAPEKASSRSA
jgi:hypothetical protein